MRCYICVETDDALYNLEMNRGFQYAGSVMRVEGSPRQKQTHATVYLRFEQYYLNLNLLIAQGDGILTVVYEVSRWNSQTI